MFFNILNLLILFITTSIFTFASPIQLDSSTPHLKIRAGPSGSLNYPYGGEIYDNSNGLGKLSVSYNQVRCRSLVSRYQFESELNFCFFVFRYIKIMFKLFQLTFQLVYLELHLLLEIQTYVSSNSFRDFKFSRAYISFSLSFFFLFRIHSSS